jgi:hypothetical protein
MRACAEPACAARRPTNDGRHRQGQAVKHLIPLLLLLGACGVRDSHARGTIVESRHVRFPNFVELTIAVDGVPFEWEEHTASPQNAGAPCATLRVMLPTGQVVATDCGADPWTLRIGETTYAAASLLLKADGSVTVLNR